MSIFGSQGIGAGSATSIDGKKGTGSDIVNTSNGLRPTGSKMTMVNGVFMMGIGVQPDDQNG